MMDPVEPQPGDLTEDRLAVVQRDVLDVVLRPQQRSRVGKLLLAIVLGVGGVLVALAIGAASGSPVVTLIIVAVSIVVLVVVATHQARLKRERRSANILRNWDLAGPHAAIAAELDQSVQELDDSAPAMLAKALAAGGRTGMTIRLLRTAEPNPPQPIVERFEACPLDETDPLLIELQRDDPGIPRGELPDSGDAASVGRSARRRFRLAGGWWLVLWFGFFGCRSVIEAWRAGRITSGLVFWIGLLLFMLLVPREFFHKSNQWLAVPGGVIVRVGSWRNRVFKLVRLARPESVFVAKPIRWQKLWEVTIASKVAAYSERFTATEMRFLIRAWLSPLEPPQVEELSDLRGEG